ncbi:hypothetical protein SDC9_212565 [bioreactor metagenome]|uniref:Uncharacterized protein n=1 Tax=bioreactor metagenome TaxID=1076179 RepID=A0A645JMB4_9ZZZZ
MFDDIVRNRPLARNVRQAVRREKSGGFDFRTVRGDVAGIILSEAPEHEGVAKRPELAVEVADVLDRNPNFLPHLAANRLLQRFAAFDEPGHQAVHGL